MNISRKDIEITAPVGSFESLMAAIQGKADSVYFGVGKLNMRSMSTVNFNISDLLKIKEICLKHNIKCYVTLNSVMYDNDFDYVREIIQKCKEYEIDGIVACDMAAILYARQIGMNIHISTQLNVSNIEAFRFYSQFAEVIVLARELNLNQVKYIFEKVLQEDIKGPSGNQVRIEMFVHGALCMAISGKCYLSLHEYNHSANRGECYQICRRSYLVTDTQTGAQLEIDNEFIMSPKDLCTIGFLDKIIEAGARVLKIEGRARSPEYVKTVSEAYNEAVNSIIENKYDNELKNKLLNKVSTVYNRGFWDGYYLGQRLGEWNNIYGSKATKRKIYIGKLMNYFSNIKIADFLVETGTLNVGDEVMIIGPSTGVIELSIKSMRVNDIDTTKAVKGDRVTFQVDTPLKRSDKLYLLVTN